MMPALAGSRRRAAQGRALYVSPHQDDEQLTYGQAILADVAAGYDVEVLLATDGRSSWSRTSPTLIARVGGTPTLEEYSDARTREFVESCRLLGATAIVPPYGVRMVDGESTPAGVRALIEAYCAPGAVLRGTSQYDYHVDHRAVGDALIALEADDFGTDLRLMLSTYSITNGWGPPEGTTRYTTDDPPWPLGYQWPYRTVDVPNDWWGVGYLDVDYIFDGITTNGVDATWHRSPA